MKRNSANNIDEQKIKKLQEFTTQRILQLLAQNNITTSSKLCKETDISASTLSEIKSGKRMASIDVIYKICIALNIELNEFFTPEADTPHEQNKRIINKYWDELGPAQQMALIAFAKGMLMTSEFK